MLLLLLLLLLYDSNRILQLLQKELRLREGLLRSLVLLDIELLQLRQFLQLLLKATKYQVTECR